MRTTQEIAAHVAQFIEHGLTSFHAFAAALEDEEWDRLYSILMYDATKDTNSQLETARGVMKRRRAVLAELADGEASSAQAGGDVLFHCDVALSLVDGGITDDIARQFFRNIKAAVARETPSETQSQ
jgi:hypothetical protein